MSLSKLNDQLKADICSFLDFKDINKLAQVNKGMKASLQRRGLDKPKIHRLCFEKKLDDKLDCFVQIHSEDRMRHKVAEIEFDKCHPLNSSEVLNWIHKFNAIEHLELINIFLEDNAGWEDMVAKIRSVELENSEIMISKEAVMKFFKKFKEVTIGLGSIIDPAYITDEFFLELARVGTTFHYKSYNKHVVAVTDASLDALSSGRIPDKLYLTGLRTGITFARVKKMIEDVLKSEMTEVRYDFGYLKRDQYNAAHTFMTEEFEGWAEGFDRSLELYRQNQPDYELYVIFNEDCSFFVEFAVYKPEELLENDNLGEAQFGDEFDDDDDWVIDLLENLEI